MLCTQHNLHAYRPAGKVGLVKNDQRRTSIISLLAGMNSNLSRGGDILHSQSCSGEIGNQVRAGNHGYLGIGEVLYPLIIYFTHVTAKELTPASNIRWGECGMKVSKGSRRSFEGVSSNIPASSRKSKIPRF